jgi:hypothetical protein
MDERELHWLAGLLEGEGSLIKPPPSDPNRPRVSIMSTDLDIIERVNKLFDVTYCKAQDRGSNRKLIYGTLLRGRAAVALMKQSIDGLPQTKAAR